MPIIGVLRGTDAGFLSVAGHYAAKTRPPSARALADDALCEQITAVHQANYSVYEVRKMHTALHRDGVQVGRDRLARLMRRLGLAGVRRGKPRRTTIADAAAVRPQDLVQRCFHAQRPNQLWVCDLTYLRLLAVAVGSDDPVSAGAGPAERAVAADRRHSYPRRVGRGALSVPGSTIRRWPPTPDPTT